MAQIPDKQPGTVKSRFFYGYTVVIAGLLIMMATMGLNYTFGIFFKPLISEFGWSRAVTSAAYSIMTITAGFLGIFAGRLSDRFGTRIVSTISGACLGTGFILMSQVTELWQVYLIYSVIVAAGIGACWPIILPLVPKWFITRKGLMTGILSSGVGLGIITGPPLASWLIYNLDWRSAYIIIGSIGLVVTVAAAQLLRDSPKQKGQRPYGEDTAKPEALAAINQGMEFHKAVRTGQFAIMCAIYFCFGFCLHSVMVHIVPHATEFKIDATTAAIIMSIIGIGSIAGKLLVGGASDRIGVRTSLITSFIVLFIAFGWLQFAREFWMFCIFGIIFALGYGGVMSMQSLMSAQLFGLRSPAAILGVISFIYTIGGSVGPFLTGYIFDLTSSYNLAFLIAAIMAIIGSALTSLLKRPPQTSS
jgi:OFA family oxalate/formate antiporter-like MFS transporter